jgi:hypothetical protein
MDNVDFLVVFSGTEDPNGLLINFLNAALDEIYGRTLPEDMKSNKIEIKYNLLRDERQLIGFNINCDEIEEDYCKGVLGLFIKNIIDAKDDGFDHLLKFNDPILFSENQRYVQEIFEIEMRLREALSIIFIDTYGNNFYKLLNDVDVKVKPPKDKDMEKYCENEFYFLLFSDYIKLSTPKNLSFEILKNHINRATDFAQFQKMLVDNPITNVVYLDFLTSLKEMVQPIEDLRNCIAHNRTISDDVISNYKQAKEPLLIAIDDFLKTISENNI